MASRIAVAFAIVLLLIVGLGQLLSNYLLESEPVPNVQAMDKKPPRVDPPKVEDPLEIKHINVVSIKGRVDRRLNDSSWVAVQPGDQLQQDETIRTKLNGYAKLKVGETATVKIEPQSQFSVREVARTVARVYLHVGRISTVVHGHHGSRFRVESKGSDAVAESDKGAFSVLTTGEGQVAVATTKGEVRFSSKNKSVNVKAGNQSVVQPESSPTTPEPIPASLYLKVVKPKTTLQRGKNATIKGTATPGAFISINGVRVISDETGLFSSKVALKEGANPVLVEAEDVSGNRESRALPTITVKSRVSTVQSKAGKWGTKRKSTAPH